MLLDRVAVTRRARRRRRAGTRVDDAFKTIDLAQQSIAGADTKASILGAATVVLLGLVADRLDLSALWEDPTPLEIAAAVLGILSLGAVALVGISLGRVLVPRVTAEQFSRYAWPAIVDTPLDALVKAPDATDRRDAWCQAQMLARIAHQKHLHLKFALRWLGVAVALTVLWSVAAASTPG